MKDKVRMFNNFYHPAKFFALFMFLIFCANSYANDNLAKISSVLETYLGNDIAAAEEEAMEQLSECDKSNSPQALLLEYLSGNKSIKPSYLIIAAEDTPSLAALTYLGLFARSLATEKNPDPFDLENYLENYLEDQAACDSKMVKEWAPRARIWLKWCQNDLKSIKGLEPLLLAKSKKSEEFIAATKKISELSKKEFIKSRQPFKKRPRPASFTFSRKKLQVYLNSLASKKLKKAERMRCNMTGHVKPYIVKLLQGTPYHGAIKMQTRNFSGTISMANENSLRIKRKGSSRAKIYKWKDIKPEQFIEFFKYYIDLRVKGFGAVVTKEERARQAAEDYMHLAFFCDWNGLYADALDSAKQAIKLCPQLNKDAVKFVYGMNSN